MKHELTHSNGTHWNNYVVRCSCGWAYSTTHNECRTRGLGHQAANSKFEWRDERRLHEREKNVPRS